MKSRQSNMTAERIEWAEDPEESEESEEPEEQEEIKIEQNKEL